MQLHLHSLLTAQHASPLAKDRHFEYASARGSLHLLAYVYAPCMLLARSLCRVLTSLYKRELVYFDVPISPSDHVSIPPLEVRAAGRGLSPTAACQCPLRAILDFLEPAQCGCPQGIDHADDMPR
jgi:FAM91 N-terminus